MKPPMPIIAQAAASQTKKRASLSSAALRDKEPVLVSNTCVLMPRASPLAFRLHPLRTSCNGLL
ncbi:hypothetical protein NSE01_07280 [Novosphingobium sediminis]|uniref:Uncharacterized protein n=1 Tax=Novosphingobium sediminis TaxID=707214 RepID=A0A512AGR1_9SPHN|nr:hypothetical protein NSE01_07280 [Novosphingobium sediminis]